MTSEERRLDDQLTSFSKNTHPLPGLEDVSQKKTLIYQLQKSQCFQADISKLFNSNIDETCIQSSNAACFNPHRGAIYFQRPGEFEEACWLVFLAVHFGDSPSERQGQWDLVRTVYDGLGSSLPWTWDQTSRDPVKFRNWLSEVQDCPLYRDLKFGNHRKYQSRKNTTKNESGTGDAVASYVEWVIAFTDHKTLFQHFLRQCGNNPQESYHQLYLNMKKQVRSFGRTACFDYLTLIGYLGLSNIEAGSAYLEGATGPLRGAKQLFQLGEVKRLDCLLVKLGECLDLNMQVIEDAVCNWQKDPSGKSIPSECRKESQGSSC